MDTCGKKKPKERASLKMEGNVSDSQPLIPIKRKRGRPRKYPLPNNNGVINVPAPKKPRKSPYVQRKRKTTFEDNIYIYNIYQKRKPKSKLKKQKLKQNKETVESTVTVGSKEPVRETYLPKASTPLSKKRKRSLDEEYLPEQPIGNKPDVENFPLALPCPSNNNNNNREAEGEIKTVKTTKKSRRDNSEQKQKKKETEQKRRVRDKKNLLHFFNTNHFVLHAAKQKKVFFFIFCFFSSVCFFFFR